LGREAGIEVEVEVEMVGENNNLTEEKLFGDNFNGIRMILTSKVGKIRRKSISVFMV